ncbi:RQC domain-containing protein [Paenibacillus tritici]|uniref:RQC domain-containing protein n=1 Tax=Paenibacillus tritici TaxID=1873425 RepID=UPI001C20828C|nr:RQC-minor-1 family DNA-binding protein [Paenibacillus tritici]
MDIRRTSRNEPKRKGSPKQQVNIALPVPELQAILRAADDIITLGGRTQLAKILKGSKEKKLLERGLDRNPSYGFYRELTLEQIMEKVDTLIHTGYLKTELYGKLPMIEFTPHGWTLERERRAEEFLREWDQWLDNGITPVSMDYLKELNRGMIFLFLFKILGSGDRKYIPFLQQWQPIEFKKVQAEIGQVIASLNERERLGEREWQELLRERSQSLIIRSRDPLILVCQQCDGLFVFDELDLSCYGADGIHYPEQCPGCRLEESGVNE